MSTWIVWEELLDPKELVLQEKREPGKMVQIGLIQEVLLDDGNVVHRASTVGPEGKSKDFRIGTMDWGGELSRQLATEWIQNGGKEKE